MPLSCEPGDLPRDASPNPQSGYAGGTVTPFVVTPCRCQIFGLRDRVSMHSINLHPTFNDLFWQGVKFALVIACAKKTYGWK